MRMSLEKFLRSKIDRSERMCCYEVETNTLRAWIEQYEDLYQTTKPMLEPVDKTQCQALKPNGHNFMSFGGRPGLVRCTNRPNVVVTEVKPGKDGLIGSMSLCSECLKVAEQQLPAGFFTTETISH